MTEKITLTETDRDLPKHVKNGFMRYKDFQPLTQGGEATLRTCLDENLGRTVVMKTLQPQFQNLETYHKRFLREARVTSQIPHPATIPVYELSRDSDGNLYFTMKKLGGRDLSDVLDRIAASDTVAIDEFPQERLINVMIHVSQCLSYSHAHGVVHRDLKPANIMIGDYGEVMVLDWGLAKVWDMADDDEVDRMLRSGQQKIAGRLTGKGDVQGTPFYMSPEQATETGDVDHRTDVYSMGIILFEILTGESYMSGRNFNEIKRKILEDPVRSPISVAPRKGITRSLNAICLKALQKEPKDRYQDMGDMEKDLRNSLIGGPVSVYEQSWVAQKLTPKKGQVFGVPSMIWIGVGIVACVTLQVLWAVIR